MRRTNRLGRKKAVTAAQTPQTPGAGADDHPVPAARDPVAGVPEAVVTPQ